MTGDPNKPVSTFNPKANPVLWGYFAPMAVAWLARRGFNVDESDLAVVITGVYVAVAFVVRHRVKPVHSDGAPVQLKKDVPQ